MPSVNRREARVRDRCGLAPLSSSDRKDDDSDLASSERVRCGRSLLETRKSYLESGRKVRSDNAVDAKIYPQGVCCWANVDVTKPGAPVVRPGRALSIRLV